MFQGNKIGSSNSLFFAFKAMLAFLEFFGGLIRSVLGYALFIYSYLLIFLLECLIKG